MISDEALLRVLFYIVGLGVCVAFAWFAEWLNDIIWSADDE